MLDVGTTGVKAFVFDENLRVISRVYRPLKKYFPKKGWVEQDPKELLIVARKALRTAVAKNKITGSSYVGLGIANQRETTILWDKKTGDDVYPALVWEDTRTQTYCAALKKRYQKTIRQKTGLAIDPYFSASKIRWILTHVPRAQTLLKENRLAFGTVDSWVLWNLAEHTPHHTDYTNASRTLIFNIKTLRWDGMLLKIFGIPKRILPRALPSVSKFGALKKEVVGHPIPILMMCGDQQASMYAAGIRSGATKVTYGTGTFIMQVLGPRFKTHADFFTTLIPDGRKPRYALEAKIAGSGQEIENALRKHRALRPILKRLSSDVNAYLKKLPVPPKTLVIDGGATRDEYLRVAQSEISGVPVQKQKIFDGTALGVASRIRDAIAKYSPH